MMGEQTEEQAREQIARLIAATSPEDMEKAERLGPGLGGLFLRWKQMGWAKIKQKKIGPPAGSLTAAGKAVADRALN